MKVAGVQMDVALGDTAANHRLISQHLEQAAAAGARLVVFPECARTGYCFDSLEHAREHAQTVPGPATARLTEDCARWGVYSVVGLLESDGARVFNTAVLVGPDGLVARYRKVHLPYLGVDRFTSLGDEPFAVHDVDGVRIGINICYDASFPEGARSLAIQGADLVVLPTNWPPGAAAVAAHVINTRAMENGVYFMAVNRLGDEGGFRFIGQSCICGPDGQTLARASEDQEQMLLADIDPEHSRRKRIVRVPDQHIIDRMADRRPEMYADLVRSHHLQRPGR
ncbi:MAG: carbon-nitrogen hydrolase family protein [Planctomycetaceae bacterium]